MSRVRWKSEIDQHKVHSVANERAESIKNEVKIENFRKVISLTSDGSKFAVVLETKSWKKHEPCLFPFPLENPRFSEEYFLSRLPFGASLSTKFRLLFISVLLNFSHYPPF